MLTKTYVKGRQQVPLGSTVDNKKLKEAKEP